MKLTVASSPHIRGNFRTNRIMLDVVLALLPALAVGAGFQGPRALIVALLSVSTCVVAEYLYSLITKSRNTAVDGSAMVTGLLLAMTLPATVPYWLVIVGDVFAIIFVKALCGGLGQNIFNPALAARAFMLLIYPVGLTRYVGLDGVTAATPLHHMVMPALPTETIGQMFVGRCPGTIGEVSALALLLGGAYLFRSADLPLGAATPVAVTAAAISAFFAGLTAARVAKCHGLLMGALCGLLLYLIILLIGLAQGGIDTGYAVIKLASLVIAGAVGGVLGVNGKRR